MTSRDGAEQEQETAARRSAALSNLADLDESLTNLLAAVRALRESPGNNNNHFHAESVRLAATVRDNAQMRLDNLINLAYLSGVSIPRLSDLASVAINTLRGRLPGLARRSVETDVGF